MLYSNTLQQEQVLCLISLNFTKVFSDDNILVSYRTYVVMSVMALFILVGPYNEMGLLKTCTLKH